MASTTPQPQRPWMIATAVLGVALVVSLALLLTGGDTAPEVTTTTTTTASSSTTVAREGDPDVVDTDDGTGRAGDELEVFAVVVDNAPGARPQVGLGDENVLVEYEVEGGITRFVAVVPTGTEGLVGPVRSLRPVNAPLGPTLASALITSGGQPDVTRSVAANGVTLLTPFEIPSFVSLGRQAPHDTFIDIEDLATYFTPFPVTMGLPLSGELPSSDLAATRVDMPFPGVSFIYETGVGWSREQDGAPFEVLDAHAAETKHLSHDTIVILYAAQRPAGYADSNGVDVAAFDVVGSGDLVVLHERTLVEGTWARSAVADPYVFRTKSGVTFGLPEGRVYLAVVSRDRPAEIS